MEKVHYWVVYRDLSGAVVRTLLNAKTRREAVGEGREHCDRIRAAHRAVLGAYLDRKHPRAFVALRIEETAVDPRETCEYVWTRGYE